MIYYIPNYNTNNCAIIYDSQTIRVYDEVPLSPGVYNYTDYFVNSHYLSRTGSTTYGNYSNNYPVCINDEVITTNYFYRNDIADIAIFTVIFIGSIWFLISKLIKTLFRGHKKL